MGMRKILKDIVFGEMVIVYTCGVACVVKMTADEVVKVFTDYGSVKELISAKRKEKLKKDLKILEKAQDIIESVQPTEGVKEKLKKELDELEKEYEAFMELRKDILDELNEEQKVQSLEETKEEELPHTCCTCRYDNLQLIQKPCCDCIHGSEWKH